MAENLIQQARQISERAVAESSFARSWARWRFQNSSNLRAEFYRAIASNMAMEQRLPEVLASIYVNDTDHDRTKPSTIGTVCRCWLRSLMQDGDQPAVLFRGWTPPHDAIVLEAIAESSFEPEAFRDLAKMTAAVGGWGIRMSLALYPIFGAIAAAMWALSMIGGKAVAGLRQLIKHPDPFTEVMFNLAVWFDNGGIIPAYVITFAIPVVVFLSLSRWSGRSRSKLDGVWPYSLYRDIQTGLTMRALARLLQSKSRRLAACFERMAQSAQPYLRVRLLEAGRHADTAMGRQFDAAGTNFPSVAVRRQFRQIANTPDVPEALNRIADEALSRAEDTVKLSAVVAGYFVTFIVGGFAIWLTLVSQLQAQSMQSIGP